MAVGKGIQRWLPTEIRHSQIPAINIPKVEVQPIGYSTFP